MSAIIQRTLFGTDGVRGIANQYPMTCELALSLGRAVAHQAKHGDHRHRILIGKDTRLSCYMLEMAFASGVCSMGVDALLIGFAQLLAVLPGISRSGFTIATGLARGFERVATARFSFLLGIPAITAAGLFELFSLTNNGGVPQSAWLGVAVAGLTGYLAIAFLLRLLARAGLSGYGFYCLVLGTIALLVL